MDMWWKAIWLARWTFSDSFPNGGEYDGDENKTAQPELQLRHRSLHGLDQYLEVREVSDHPVHLGDPDHSDGADHLDVTLLFKLISPRTQSQCSHP